MSQNLTEKQHLAIRHLAGGLTSMEVAERLGITRETISRWRKDTEFYNELNSVITELYNHTQYNMNALASHAVSAIREALLNDTYSEKRARIAISTLKLLESSRKKSSRWMSWDDAIAAKTFVPPARCELDDD